MKHLIIDNDKCIGCGLCKQVCIRDNIEIVDNKLVLVQKEPAVLGYAKLRAREYPEVKDQLDMLWHAIDEERLDKTSEFYKKLKPVKDKYPKQT